MTRRLAVRPREWQAELLCVVVSFATITSLASVPAAVAAPQQKKAKKEAKEPPKEGTKYENAEEAFRDGIAYLQLKEFAKSQAPLEQALKLAADDSYRIKVYEFLMEPYRQLPEPDKMIEACEFIIEKSDFQPKRSLTRNALLSFVYQRGKVDPAVQHFEDVLKKEPNHRAANYILSEMYNRVKPNPKRRVELLEKLVVLSEKEGDEFRRGTQGQLAGAYVGTGKVKEGAELYEKLAKEDAKQAGSLWKDAAGAWLKAGDKDKALAAAKSADAAPGERPSGLLGYYFHQQLGDIFVQTGEPKLAIPHYEKALANTDIAGYKKDTEKKLEDARAKAQ